MTALKLATVLALALLAGCGTPEEVQTYCAYGARSQAQLDGCLEHVTLEYIATSNTRAARCARGSERACRGGFEWIIWRDRMDRMLPERDQY